MARPQQYNRQTVVEQAMNLFWQRGYQATSVSNLVEATGLRPSSLYGAFGNKEGVLLASLENYTHQIESLVKDTFKHHSTAREGVLAYLRILACEVDGKRFANGCLLINILLELAGNNQEVCSEVSRLLSRIEQSFERVFQRAKLEGDLEQTADCTQLATFMMGTVCSIRVMSRLSTDKQRMEALIEPAMKGMFK